MNNRENEALIKEAERIFDKIMAGRCRVKSSSRPFNAWTEKTQEHFLALARISMST